MASTIEEISGFTTRITPSAMVSGMTPSLLIPAGASRIRTSNSLTRSVMTSFNRSGFDCWKPCRESPHGTTFTPNGPS
ncbi:hypothetical protein DSECCO2_435600 [anaerobic digester metagenome]